MPPESALTDAGPAVNTLARAAVVEMARTAATRASRARTEHGRTAAAERWREHLSPLGALLLASTAGGAP